MLLQKFTLTSITLSVPLHYRYAEKLGLLDSLVDELMATSAFRLHVEEVKESHIKCQKIIRKRDREEKERERLDVVDGVNQTTADASMDHEGEKGESESSENGVVGEGGMENTGENAGKTGESEDVAGANGRPKRKRSKPMDLVQAESAGKRPYPTPSQHSTSLTLSFTHSLTHSLTHSSYTYIYVYHTMQRALLRSGDSSRLPSHGTQTAHWLATRTAPSRPTPVPRNRRLRTFCWRSLRR